MTGTPAGASERPASALSRSPAPSTDLGGSDGLRDWLAVFGDSLFAPLDDTERGAVVSAVENRLRDEHFDPASETWTADYRRLRFVAVRE